MRCPHRWAVKDEYLKIRLQFTPTAFGFCSWAQVCMSFCWQEREMAQSWLQSRPGAAWCRFGVREPVVGDLEWRYLPGFPWGELIPGKQEEENRADRKIVSKLKAFAFNHRFQQMLFLSFDILHFGRIFFLWFFFFPWAEAMAGSTTQFQNDCFRLHHSVKTLKF